MAKLTETTGERVFNLELNLREAQYLATVLSHVSGEGDLYMLDLKLFDALHDGVGTLDNADVSGSIHIKDTE